MPKMNFMRLRIPFKKQAFFHKDIALVGILSGRRLTSRKNIGQAVLYLKVYYVKFMTLKYYPYFLSQCNLC